MLEKLKKMFGAPEKEVSIKLLAPLDGEAVPLSEVPDLTFAEEMLGKGAAIIPTNGRVLSPVNGKVLGIFRTCHAVTLLSEDGAEILIHIGIDTVKLDGKHYTPHVVKGDTIKIGDLLIEFDPEAIKAEGYNIITPVLVCNTDEYKDITGARGSIKSGETFITLTAK